ncbi:MAG: Crp/Fnr family transcriptional regulator, partial [Pyrinomonadaceae bacterium]
RAIPAHDFLHLLKTDTQISLYLHQMQSREVCEQFLHTAELGCLSVQHRLEQLLWRLISALEMSDTRQEVKLELPLKHSEIAQLLSVTPEHLSRVLKRMQLEGILRQEKGWLIISQPHKLRHQNYFKESSYRFSVAREQ